MYPFIISISRYF